jgi:hypothetical protein
LIAITDPVPNPPSASTTTAATTAATSTTITTTSKHSYTTASRDLKLFANKTYTVKQNVMYLST